MINSAFQIAWTIVMGKKKKTCLCSQNCIINTVDLDLEYKQLGTEKD